MVNSHSHLKSPYVFVYFALSLKGLVKVSLLTSCSREYFGNLVQSFREINQIVIDLMFRIHRFYFVSIYDLLFVRELNAIRLLHVEDVG